MSTNIMMKPFCLKPVELLSTQKIKVMQFGQIPVLVLKIMIENI